MDLEGSDWALAMARYGMVATISRSEAASGLLPVRFGCTPSKAILQLKLTTAARRVRPAAGIAVRRWPGAQVTQTASGALPQAAKDKMPVIM
jgi:hypothetical protein